MPVPCGMICKQVCQELLTQKFAAMQHGQNNMETFGAQSSAFWPCAFVASRFYDFMTTLIEIGDGSVCEISGL